MLGSCELEIAPFDGVTKDNLANVPNALLTATNGAYSLMKDQLAYKGVNDFPQHLCAKPASDAGILQRQRDA